MIQSFAALNLGETGRGAIVDALEVVYVGGGDFSVKAAFHSIPAGENLTDTIGSMKAYMAGCRASTPSEVAAMWQQELDELVLAH